MDIVYVEFKRCELNGLWDFTESDKKTFCETKDESAVLDLLLESDKKENHKFKKVMMVRISSNIVRINREGTK